MRSANRHDSNPLRLARRPRGGLRGLSSPVHRATDATRPVPRNRVSRFCEPVLTPPRIRPLARTLAMSLSLALALALALSPALPLARAPLRLPQLRHRLADPLQPLADRVVPGRVRDSDEAGGAEGGAGHDGAARFFEQIARDVEIVF